VTTKPRRKLGSTVGRNEVLRDRRGHVVDGEHVEGAVEFAIDYVRARALPSLSTNGESPLLRVRVSRDLDVAIRRAAGDSGETVATWVRRVLDNAARPSS